MSNIAPISINIGDETDPIEVVFSPNGFPAKDLAEFEDKTVSIPLGRDKIRITTIRGNAVKNTVVKFQIDSPVLAATSPSTSTGIEPAASRAYNVIAKGEFVLDRRSSAGRRQRVLRLMGGLMSSEVLQQAVEDLDFPY